MSADFMGDECKNCQAALAVRLVALSFVVFDPRLSVKSASNKS